MTFSALKLYLKSYCQADWYKIIVENNECQEWHAKVLRPFPYERQKIKNNK